MDPEETACRPLASRARPLPGPSRVPTRPEFPPLGFVQLAAGRPRAQVADGALVGARTPWPAKRVDRSSMMVAAPGTFNLLAVLTDW